ncbi:MULTISPECIES: hypothetical protein [Acidithiobacillus]|uniref:hypothetical protein n=1 Tax=Acidithiobacillus TaxID=119977 RepID=UPI0004E21CAD|nr:MULTISPECIES: hypothetical protein [Acidithiobacillus]MBU2835192.1 hypothetical protein [Acidithiobacillus thiooxidans]MDA8177450.1 hypothetical protein [Acidithiobacillus sp.]
MNTDTFPNMVTVLLSKAQDMLGQRLPKDAGIHLPYCWHDVPGTTEMILLNRSYKPVGNNSGGKTWLDYADFPELLAPRAVIHGIGGMRRNQSFPEDPRQWFYNDLTAPQRGPVVYKQRLADLIQANLDALQVAS